MEPFTSPPSWCSSSDTRNRLNQQKIAKSFFAPYPSRRTEQPKPFATVPCGWPRRVPPHDCSSYVRCVYMQIAIISIGPFRHPKKSVKRVALAPFLCRVAICPPICLSGPRWYHQMDCHRTQVTGTFADFQIAMGSLSLLDARTGSHTASVGGTSFRSACDSTGF